MKTADSSNTLAAVAVLAFGCLGAWATDAAYSLCVLATPSFIADSTGVAPGVWLNVLNSSNTSAVVNLRVTDFINSITSNRLGAKVDLYTGTNGSPYGSQITAFASNNLLIWVQSTKIFEAGESTAQILLRREYPPSGH